MSETAVDNAKYRRLRANGVPHAQAVAMAAVTPTVDFSPPSSLATDLELSSALAVKAPLASPAFTGAPTKNGSPVQSAADVAGAYVTVVEHGATAGTARPTGAVRVFWRGSVQPTNAVQYDRWINTSGSPYTESIYDGSAWTALGGASSPIETVNTVAASGAAQTLPDVTTATIHDITLTANCTLIFPTPAAGKSFLLRLTQDGIGVPVLASLVNASTGGSLTGGTFGYRVSATNAIGETLASNELALVVGVATPTNLVNTTATTGGTLAAGTYYYRVSALNATGESLASVENAIITTGSTSTVTVNWNAVAGATGYKIYGRATGAELLIATVGAVTSYVDTGSVTPSGALPTANTSAGSTNAITLTWGAVTGATGYKVYGRTVSGELLIATVGAVTTYVDTGSVTPSGAMLVFATAGGSRLVTWPASVKWPSGLAPVLSTGTQKQDLISFTSISGAAWNGLLAGLDLR